MHTAACRVKIQMAKEKRVLGSRIFWTHLAQSIGKRSLAQQAIEDTARDETGVPHEGGAGLHVRVGLVGGEGAGGNQRIGRAHELLVVVGREGLPAVQDGEEGPDGGALLDGAERVPVLRLQPPVAVPHRKEVVPTRGGQRQGARSVGVAPPAAAQSAARARRPTRRAMVRAVKDEPTIDKWAADHSSCPTICGWRVIRMTPVSQRWRRGFSTAATSLRLKTDG